MPKSLNGARRRASRRRDLPSAAPEGHGEERAHRSGAERAGCAEERRVDVLERRARGLHDDGERADGGGHDRPGARKDARRATSASRRGRSRCAARAPRASSTRGPSAARPSGRSRGRPPNSVRGTRSARGARRRRSRRRSPRSVATAATSNTTEPASGSRRSRRVSRGPAADAGSSCRSAEGSSSACRAAPRRSSFQILRRSCSKSRSWPPLPA